VRLLEVSYGWLIGVKNESFYILQLNFQYMPKEKKNKKSYRELLNFYYYDFLTILLPLLIIVMNLIISIFLGFSFVYFIIAFTITTLSSIFLFKVIEKRISFKIAIKITGIYLLAVLIGSSFTDYSKFPAVLLISFLAAYYISIMEDIFPNIIEPKRKVIKRYQKTQISSNTTVSEKHNNWGKVVQFLVISVLGVIISNQIAQPLFFPRLSTFSISEPLYVQSDIENNEPVYYKVFKITYKIEPSLLPPQNQILTIELPGKEKPFFTKNIELITQLIQTSPYVSLPADMKTGFNSTEDLNYKLNLNISTNGFNVKSFDFILFFREATDIDLEYRRDNWHNWWSSDTVYPEIPVVIEQYYSQSKAIGTYENRTFSFEYLYVTNKNDFPVKDFWIGSNSNTTRVCDGDVELSDRTIGNKRYFVISLDAHESLKLLTYDEVPNGYFNRFTDKKINIDNFWCADLSKRIVI
jgi:hypothetical protein